MLDTLGELMYTGVPRNFSTGSCKQCPQHSTRKQTLWIIRRKKLENNTIRIYLAEIM